MKNIRVIKDDKFKDILISLRFSAPKTDNVSARALLAMMMSDRSKKYHTKVLMNEALDNMFGANLSSAVLNYGKAHILELSLAALSPKYVEENLLESQVKFLSELVYNPLLSQEGFNEAKELLKDLIDREIDSLGAYVVNESLRVAGKGYPLETSRYGDLEMLETITLDDVKREYESLINNDSLNIMVVGSVDENHMIDVLKKYFKHHNYDDFETSYLIKNTGNNEVVRMNIPSPYFSIVYNTHTYNTKKDYWTLQLMSMVLGQLPNSFLFQEVREKRSLCYSIRAIVSGYDGVLIISAGVREGHDDEAIDLSMEQVRRVQNNEVSLELFNSAKVMLMNTINQTEDSSTRLIDSNYRQVILKEDMNTQEILEMIDSITLEDIVTISKRLELNTVYKLEKGN